MSLRDALGPRQITILVVGFALVAVGLVGLLTL